MHRIHRYLVSHNIHSDTILPLNIAHDLWMKIVWIPHSYCFTSQINKQKCVLVVCTFNSFVIMYTHLLNHKSPSLFQNRFPMFSSNWLCFTLQIIYVKFEMTQDLYIFIDLNFVKSELVHSMHPTLWLILLAIFFKQAKL